MEVDLFGEPVKPPTLGGTGKPKRKATKPNGYAGIPGNGPAGETCGSCRHIYRNRQSKVYLKCELCRATWTHGPGSDIRARSPACDYWEAKP